MNVEIFVPKGGDLLSVEVPPMPSGGGGRSIGIHIIQTEGVKFSESDAMSFIFEYYDDVGIAVAANFIYERLKGICSWIRIRKKKVPLEIEEIKSALRQILTEDQSSSRDPP